MYKAQHTSKISLKDNQLWEVIKALFPNHAEQIWSRVRIPEEDIPECTKEDVLKGIEKLKSKKAPGTDNILPEIIKETIKQVPHVLANMFTELLTSTTFPAQWKMAKLVLIEKQKKENDEDI